MMVNANKLCINSPPSFNEVESGSSCRMRAEGALSPVESKFTWTSLSMMENLRKGKESGTSVDLLDMDTQVTVLPKPVEEI